MHFYHFLFKMPIEYQFSGFFLIFPFLKKNLVKIPSMRRYYGKHEPSIDFSVVLEAIKQIKTHKNLIQSDAESKDI